LEPKLEAAEADLGAALARVPNVPHPSAPEGFTDEDAAEVRKGGAPVRSFDFEPRDHVALGELLGVLDVERAVRTSGSRFVYLLGDIVLLQWALVRHALDVLVSKGFTPVVPPVLVREEAMFGTGFLPTDEVNIYVTREDDLYLVGTSEVPLAALHMTEILDEVDLPRRYAGYSTCFRREAGTYGKDMGGMFRVHQFDKVEMFSFARPEDSWDEHEFLVSVEEEIVGNLELPYRVVNIAAGDLGGMAAKKYDIEVWLPGQQRYRELTSCSNCTDYQARRLQTRVRRTAGGNEMLHTLNGTATAVSRTLIAILENHQRADGSVGIPQKLHPYLPPALREMRPKS
jgi:seryl-tRNA synthetase